MPSETAPLLSERTYHLG